MKILQIPHLIFDTKNKFFFKPCITLQQTFINYKFLCTRFRARKTVLGARSCAWKIVHVKEQMCTLLIITRHGGRNCTKLVLKKTWQLKTASLFQSCLLLFPVDYSTLVYMITTLHFCSLYNTRSIHIIALRFLIN